ncbi:MAG: hypothetical protein WBX15_07820 [Thermoanaerobaculia bacterium]
MPFRYAQRCCLLLLLIASSLSVPAASAAGYRLDLELDPAAPFPFLSRFGTVELKVYPNGIYAETLLFHAFTRNGTKSVRIESGLTRGYAEVSVAELRSVILRLSGSKGEVMPGLREFPIDPHVLRGNVNGIAASRYRVVLGTSWIDVWTTQVIPENPQLRVLATELVSTISRPAAGVVRKIPGTPVLIEMHTRRFPKLQLLRATKLVPSSAGEESALTPGTFYVRAPIVDLLFR